MNFNNTQQSLKFLGETTSAIWHRCAVVRAYNPNFSKNIPTIFASSVCFFCCVHSFVSFNVLFFLRYARRCIMWLKTVCSHATCIQWCQEEKNYPFRLIFTHIEMDEKKTSTTFSTLNEIYFPKKKSYHININRT